MLKKIAKKGKRKIIKKIDSSFFHHLRRTTSKLKIRIKRMIPEYLNFRKVMKKMLLKQVRKLKKTAE